MITSENEDELTSRIEVELKSQIALDGPSGAGKSTLGRALRNKLGWPVVDSGNLYRGFAYLALQKSLLPSDSEALLQLVRLMRFLSSSNGLQVADCPAEAIRNEGVAAYASEVALNRSVKAGLTEKIRGIVEQEPCVVVGRDAGTRIAPKAALKVYLTAPLAVRAVRRARQVESGVADAARAMYLRDLRAGGGPALDAVVLHTGMAKPLEVTNRVLLFAEERGLLALSSLR